MQSKNLSQTAEPLVSVIIPVYNVSPYLHEALDSVINQSYTNLEVLIIDDGSTDGSGEICEEYKKDPRVIVIHQENKGLSSARNAGIDIMTGDVVAFLDSDDAYHKEYIHTLLEAMNRYEADIVICKYSNYRTTDIMRDSKPFSLQPNVKQGLYDKRQTLCFLADGSINHSVWNKIYKRNIWNDLRFPDGHVYEDLDTIYRAFDVCQSVCIICQSLYYHRVRPGSITQEFKWSTNKDFLLANSHFLSYIELHSPELFSLEQTEKCKREHLRFLICAYSRFNRIGNEENKELISKIIDNAKGLDIERCDLRTRAAYWIACHCPLLLKLVYPIYLPIRFLFYRVFKR